MTTNKKWIKIRGIRFYRYNMSKAEILAIKVLLERTEGVSNITVACDKSENVYQATYWFGEPHSCRDDNFYLCMFYQYHVPIDYALVIETESGQGEVLNCSCSSIPGDYKPCAWPV